jgi:acetolactate decarboxylase
MTTQAPRARHGSPLVLCLFLAFPSAPAAQTAGTRDTLYVSAPFVGLADGVYDGEVTFAELKRHGDLGLGAVSASDGELVLLDGRCHQVKADGSVVLLPDSLTTPWAIAAFFEREWQVEWTETVDLPALRVLLDSKLGTPGLPYAFRIDGTFAQVRTRSVAAQKPPYRRLIEVVKDQVTFDLENVSGTIVGFRIPAYLEGVNVPGYHMHFLTADRKAGGHLLAFRASRLSASADALTSVHVTLPRDPRFSKKDFPRLDRTEMDQILGRIPLGEAPRPPQPRSQP